MVIEVGFVILAIISPVIAVYGVLLGLRHNARGEPQKPLIPQFRESKKEEVQEIPEVASEAAQIINEWVNGAGDE